MTHPVRHVEKQTTPQRNINLEPTQPIDRHPGTEDRKDRKKSHREPIKATLMNLLKIQLKIKAATDRPETTKLLLPPIPEIVWQQAQETHLTIIHKTSKNETHKETHMPKITQRNDVESQTSPMKETSPQVSRTTWEPPHGNQTGNTPVQSLNDSKKTKSAI